MIARRRLSASAWLLVPVAAGMALATLATHQGAGLSPDSAVYLGAAEQLATGAGLTHLSGATLTHFPPLYPLALAASAWVAGDLRAGARGLNVLLFGANLLLIGLAVRGAGGSVPAALVAAAAAAGTKELVALHAMAWSEPLAWFLGFGGLLAAARYAERGGKPLLAGAALALGLATLCRYAAAAFPMAGAVGLLLVRPRRPAAALVVAGLGLLPLAAWMMRNLRVAGSPGRTPAFHPLTRGEALELFLWALPMIALLAGVLVTRRRRLDAGPGPLITFLAAFTALYLGSVAFSVSFFDRHTVVDGRILSPVFMAAIMALPAGVARLVSGTPWARIALGVGVLAVLGFGVDGAGWAARHCGTGIGYASVSWGGSELLDRVRALPRDARLYTNGSDAVYLLAERRAIDLPRVVDPTTLRPRLTHTAEMSALAADTGAYVAYFDRIRRTYMPDEAALTARVPLRLVEQTADGVLYRIEPPG